VSPGHLLSTPKIEIKENIDVGKTTFYNFKALNAQTPRRSFHVDMLILVSGGTV
jgi:hypothetical protein